MRFLPGSAHTILIITVAFWPAVIVAAAAFFLGDTSAMFGYILLGAAAWAIYNYLRMRSLVNQAARAALRKPRRRRARR
jgi:hypothetical protein